MFCLDNCPTAGLVCLDYQILENLRNCMEGIFLTAAKLYSVAVGMV